MSAVSQNVIETSLTNRNKKYMTKPKILKCLPHSLWAMHGFILLTSDNANCNFSLNLISIYFTEFTSESLIDPF